MNWKTAHIGEDGEGKEVWYMEVDEADEKVKKLGKDLEWAEDQEGKERCRRFKAEAKIKKLENLIRDVCVGDQVDCFKRCEHRDICPKNRDYIEGA